MKKKEEISRGVRGHAPWKMCKSRLKSEQSEAFWRQTERNFHTEIHDEYPFCTFSLHSQIHHLNFHRQKSTLVDFFPHGQIFPAIFYFLLCENPRFRDDFQALLYLGEAACNIDYAHPSLWYTLHIAGCLVIQRANQQELLMVCCSQPSKVCRCQDWPLCPSPTPPFCLSMVCGPRSSGGYNIQCVVGCDCFGVCSQVWMFHCCRPHVLFVFSDANTVCGRYSLWQVYCCLSLVTVSFFCNHVFFRWFKVCSPSVIIDQAYFVVVVCVCACASVCVFWRQSKLTAYTLSIPSLSAKSSDHQPVKVDRHRALRQWYTVLYSLLQCH